MLLYAAALRRSARAKADLMEAFASGYAACKTKDGAKAMERLLHLLRER